MKSSQCTDGGGKGRRIAMFTGSFDPFTRGHESVVERALPLFDEIVVAIGVNFGKHTLTPMELRRQWIESTFSHEPKVRVITYTGLTADAARQCGARYLLRGVRTVADFESEKTMAEVNRELSGLETVLLYTLPECSHISSSLVRELVKYGQSVERYLPKGLDRSLVPPEWTGAGRK